MIVQDDRFDATDSITVCVFTTDPTEAPLFRLAVDPRPGNGLPSTSRPMADEPVTVPRPRLGGRIGRLDDRDMARLDRAIPVFLGLV